jgi:hypothetical protein
MGDEVNIGGPTSQNTWAAVRSPIWKGTGFRNVDGGNTFPDNENWSRYTKPFSSGYPKAIGNDGMLCRAFPYWKDDVPSAYELGTSMGLGVNWSIDYGPGDNQTINYYLAIGTEFAIDAGSGGQIADQVMTGYYLPDGSPPSSQPVGFDMPSARDNFLHATIRVKLKDLNTNLFTDHSIQITTVKLPDFLPDDQQVAGNPYYYTSGTLIASMVFTPGGTVTNPLWEIKSIQWPEPPPP